jgi:hypothetical protein
MKRLGWKKSRRRQAGSSHPADGYVYEGFANKKSEPPADADPDVCF